MARNRRFQHGSLFKRGKQRKVWVARWWENVIQSDGNIGRVRRSEILGTVAELPTQREAERVRADRLRRINSGDYQPTSVRTFREFVESSWLPEVLPALKYSTKQHYQYVLRVHLLPAFGDTQLRLITREAIQQLLAVKGRSGLSWKTVRHLRTVLGIVLGAAENAGIIDRNPPRSIRLPRRPQAQEKPAIAPEKILALLEALPEPSRSIAWLLVITGMRVGELLALRWQDVDFTNRLVRVHQSVYEGHFDDPKTKHSRRTIPLKAKGIEILSARMTTEAKPEALVFATRNGTPLSRRNLLRLQLAPAAERVGLKGINWHWLRHANATLHDSLGTPRGTLQNLLGHSSPEMTNHYTHSVPTDAERAVENIENLLRNANGPKRTQVPDFGKLGSTLIQ